MKVSSEWTDPLVHFINPIVNLLAEITRTQTARTINNLKHYSTSVHQLCKAVMDACATPDFSKIVTAFTDTFQIKSRMDSVSEPKEDVVIQEYFETVGSYSKGMVKVLSESETSCYYGGDLKKDQTLKFHENKCVIADKYACATLIDLDDIILDETTYDDSPKSPIGPTFIWIKASKDVDDPPIYTGKKSIRDIDVDTWEKCISNEMKVTFYATDNHFKDVSQLMDFVQTPVAMTVVGNSKDKFVNRTYHFYDFQTMIPQNILEIPTGVGCPGLKTKTVKFPNIPASFTFKGVIAKDYAYSSLYSQSIKEFWLSRNADEKILSVSTMENNQWTSYIEDFNEGVTYTNTFSFTDYDRKSCKISPINQHSYDMKSKGIQYFDKLPQLFADANWYYLGNGFVENIEVEIFENIIYNKTLFFLDKDYDRVVVTFYFDTNDVKYAERGGFDVNRALVQMKFTIYNKYGYVDSMKLRVFEWREAAYPVDLSSCFYESGKTELTLEVEHHTNYTFLDSHHLMISSAVKDYLEDKYGISEIRMTQFRQTIIMDKFYISFYIIAEPPATTRFNREGYAHISDHDTRIGGNDVSLNECANHCLNIAGSDSERKSVISNSKLVKDLMDNIKLNSVPIKVNALSNTEFVVIPMIITKAWENADFHQQPTDNPFSYEKVSDEYTLKDNTAGVDMFDTKASTEHDCLMHCNMEDACETVSFCTGTNTCSGSSKRIDSVTGDNEKYVEKNSDCAIYDKTAPEVHEEFAAGKFTVHQTAGDFNGVWTDLALEQTYNREGQILAATTLVDAKRLGLKVMDAATTTNADKIVQPKMETFATHLKKIQKKIDTVKEVIREESAVTRALCFAQNLSDEARTEAFSYEWLEYPPSLFEPEKNGYSMRKGCKSTYLSTLQAEVANSWEPIKELPPSAVDAVYVVDAMAFIQRFNTLGSSTFGQLQERYREKLVNMKPRHCTEVHFVGDQYDFGLKSLKGYERQRRESNINLPEYVPADSMKIPDWKTLLSNPCNNTNMLSYLASRWSQEASWPAGFCLVLGVITEARTFFCDLYGKPGSWISLDKLRAHLFESKKLDLRSLPPTEDAFHFHVLRSLCQISLYKQASLSNPVLLPPEEYGRIVYGDRLIPVMKSNPSKPSAAKLKYCKCKKKPNCLRNCPCAKAAVPCIIACACNGDREKCGRLLTDHYDDDDDDE
ncbi:hypothetical protein GQR58_009358 [Nymphon striatum]|nr:hypothetical protein GQR58_009358 [Nymphon striatum]